MNLKRERHTDRAEIERKWGREREGGVRGEKEMMFLKVQSLVDII